MAFIELDPAMEKRIDEGLHILKKRNPDLDWSREQLMRLALGYGLNALFRENKRQVVDIPAMCRRLYPPGSWVKAVIEDLSLGGVGLFFPDGFDVRKNQVLLLDFRSPRSGRSVEAAVLVRRVHGFRAGALFCDPDGILAIRSFWADGGLRPSEGKIPG